MLDAVDDGLLELVVGRHGRDCIVEPLTLLQQESSSLSLDPRAGPLFSVLEVDAPRPHVLKTRRDVGGEPAANNTQHLVCICFGPTYIVANSPFRLYIWPSPFLVGFL